MASPRPPSLVQAHHDRLPEQRGLQAAVLQSQVQQNVPCLNADVEPLLQQRRFDEARPLLETLLQLQPEHPEALYNLGVLASEEGRLEEARLLLRRAVVANAGDAHAQANAYVARGLAALRQENRAEARQALEAAIELVAPRGVRLSLPIRMGGRSAAAEARGRTE